VRACTVSTSIQPTTSAVRTSCDIASKILSKLMSADENSPPTPPRHASQSWSVTFSLRAPTLQVAMRCDAMRSASPMGTAFARSTEPKIACCSGREAAGWLAAALRALIIGAALPRQMRTCFCVRIRRNRALIELATAPRISRVNPKCVDRRGLSFRAMEPIRVDNSGRRQAQLSNGATERTAMAARVLQHRRPIH
jgi:hypothetical protein